MGWAARANPTAQAVKRGGMKRKADKPIEVGRTYLLPQAFRRSWGDTMMLPAVMAALTARK